MTSYTNVPASCSWWSNDWRLLGTCLSAFKRGAVRSLLAVLRPTQGLAGSTHMPVKAIVGEYTGPFVSGDANVGRLASREGS